LANIGIGGVASPPAAQPSSYQLVQKTPNMLPKISTDSNQTTLAPSPDLNVSSAPTLGKATSLPEVPTKSIEESKESSSEEVGTTNIELDPEPNARNSTTAVPPPVRAAPAAPKKRQEDKSVAMVQKLWKKNPTANERMLPSVSVLVVEDNAINQAILGAFLRRHKIRYQIAKNGQEAVDKWSKGGFHLVLMDIQLPVISGIEATKKIRRLEKINKIGVFAEDETGQVKSAELEEVAPEDRLDLNIFRSPVIIVALTASSNSSVDKTNALRAGCNDYLTKPVNLVWLQNKITEWGCMQALIDFEGWKTKRSDEGFNAIKGKAKGVILPSGKLVVSA
jgi:osomolarity two-component system response regulator SSK1